MNLHRLAQHTSHFCLCQRWDRAGKLWKTQSDCEDFQLREKAARFYFNSQQTWWMRALQGTRSSSQRLSSNPSVRICQGGRAAGIAEWNCSQTLSENILRQPSSSTAERIRLLLFYLCSLKGRAQLKKATGCEILHPIGNQMSGAVAVSTVQDRNWSWSQGKCQEFLSWEKFLSQ